MTMLLVLLVLLRMLVPRSVMPMVAVPPRRQQPLPPPLQGLVVAAQTGVEMGLGSVSRLAWPRAGENLAASRSR